MDLPKVTVIDPDKGRKWKAYVITLAVGMLIQFLDVFGIHIDPDVKAKIIDFILKALGLYVAGNVLAKIGTIFNGKGGEKT